MGGNTFAWLNCIMLKMSLWTRLLNLCVYVAYLEERLFEKRSRFCGGGGGGGEGYLRTYPGKGISIL